MFIIITISLILLFCQLTYKAQYIYSIDNDRILTYCLVLSLIDSRRNVYERYRYPRTEVWKNEKNRNLYLKMQQLLREQILTQVLA